MLTAGLILMIAAVLDPMEGSIAVLAGSAIAATQKTRTRVKMAGIETIILLFILPGGGSNFRNGDPGGNIKGRRGV